MTTPIAAATKTIPSAGRWTLQGITESVLTGHFFQFYVKSSLARAHLQLAHEQQNAEFDELLDTPLSKLQGTFNRDKITTYLSVLNTANQSLASPLYENGFTLEMTLRTLLVREEAMIQAYVKASIADETRRTAWLLDDTLYTIYGRDSLQKHLPRITAELLYDFPQYLDAQQAEYVHTLHERIASCVPAGTYQSAYWSEDSTFDYSNCHKNDLDEQGRIIRKPHLEKPTFTTKSATLLTVPPTFVAILLGANQIIDPYLALSTLSASAIALAIPPVLKRRYAHALEKSHNPAILLNDAFSQAYQNAPEWKQILNPQTLQAKWLLRSYFALMHELPPAHNDQFPRSGRIDFTNLSARSYAKLVCSFYSLVPTVPDQHNRALIDFTFIRVIVPQTAESV